MWQDANFLQWKLGGGGGRADDSVFALICLKKWKYFIKQTFVFY